MVVSDIPEDAVGGTKHESVSFKFDFACDSSLQGTMWKPRPVFHVQVYGQTSWNYGTKLIKRLSYPVKGEIIQRTIQTNGDNVGVINILFRQHDGITF